MITNNAKCACKIRARFAMAKAAINNKTFLFFTNKLHLNIRKKLVQWCKWSMALCGAETWTLQKVDQKF